MNCASKIREKATTDPSALKEKEEREDLEILLEGRYVAEDYLS